MLEVEAVQNSSTTQDTAPKKRAAQQQLQTGGRPKLPHMGKHREGRRDRGSDKISFTPPPLQNEHCPVFKTMRPRNFIENFP